MQMKRLRKIEEACRFSMSHGMREPDFQSAENSVPGLERMYSSCIFTAAMKTS